MGRAFARSGALIQGERSMISTILLILLVILLIGAIPAWPYSRNWGYYPSGAIALLFVILLIVVLLGKFPW